MLNIALGKWRCRIDSFIFSGDIFMTVRNKNGEYDFELEVPGITAPDFEFKRIEESGNRVNATVFVPAVKKEAELDITFSQNSFEGFLKVPLLGKIKLKNAVKVE